VSDEEGNPQEPEAGPEEPSEDASEVAEEAEEGEEGEEAGEAETGVPEVALAHLSDRFLAYVIDALLFLVPTSLILRSLYPKGPPPAVEVGWGLMGAGSYVVYNAFLNADGRATLGKWLLGIRVLTTQGEPLGIGRSLVRALGYFLSGIFLELGFLWAAAHPMRQAWHDLLAGTVVVERREKGPGGRVLSFVLAAAVFSVLVFTSLRAWKRSRLPPEVRAAQEVLELVGELEEAYRARHGRYTSDVQALAAEAGGVEAFRSSLLASLRPEGFGVEADEKGYLIVGVALDGTPVRLRGP